MINGEGARGTFESTVTRYQCLRAQRTPIVCRPSLPAFAESNHSTIVCICRSGDKESSQMMISYIYFDNSQSNIDNFELISLAIFFRRRGDNAKTSRSLNSCFNDCKSSRCIILPPRMHNNVVDLVFVHERRAVVVGVSPSLGMFILMQTSVGIFLVSIAWKKIFILEKMWTFQKIKYEKLSDTNYRNIQIIKLVYFSCNFWGRVKSRWIYCFRERKVSYRKF